MVLPHFATPSHGLWLRITDLDRYRCDMLEAYNGFLLWHYAHFVNPPSNFDTFLAAVLHKVS